MNDEKLMLQLPRGTEGTLELRVVFSEYNGHPFIGVREWFKTQEGEWRPTKKGFSIKPREVGKVIATLQQYPSAKPKQADLELPPDEGSDIPF